MKKLLATAFSALALLFGVASVVVADVSGSRRVDDERRWFRAAGIGACARWHGHPAQRDDAAGSVMTAVVERRVTLLSGLAAFVGFVGSSEATSSSASISSTTRRCSWTPSREAARGASVGTGGVPRVRGNAGARRSSPACRRTTPRPWCSPPHVDRLQATEPPSRPTAGAGTDCPGHLPAPPGPVSRRGSDVPRGPRGGRGAARTGRRATRPRLERGGDRLQVHGPVRRGRAALPAGLGARRADVGAGQPGRRRHPPQPRRPGACGRSVRRRRGPGSTRGRDPAGRVRSRAPRGGRGPGSAGGHPRRAGPVGGGRRAAHPRADGLRAGLRTGPLRSRRHAAQPRRDPPAERGPRAGGDALSACPGDQGARSWVRSTPSW